MLIDLSIIANLLAAAIAVRKCRTWLNPFTCVMLCFATSGVILSQELLVPSWNWTSDILPETELFIFLMSGSLLVVTLFVRSNPWTLHDAAPFSTLVMRTTILLSFAETVIHLILLLVRNGGALPLTLLSNSFAQGRGATYDEFLIPFLTPLTWGACRLMAVLLCMDLLLRRETLLTHVSRYPVEYALTMLAHIATLGAAMRNVVIWPVAIFILGLARKQVLSPRHKFAIAIVAVVTTLAFVIIGNFRVGGSFILDSPFSRLMSIQIKNPLAETVMAWITCYAGTVYPNLNAMIAAPPDPGHGIMLLRQIVPDSLLQLFITPPPTGIEYLSSEDLLPYFGLTFRTIFTDLYADFGYWGSLLAGTGIYAGSIWAFNRSSTNPVWLAVYLCVVPGILMFPLMNFYLGVSALTPVIILPFLLRYGRARHAKLPLKAPPQALPVPSQAPA